MEKITNNFMQYVSWTHMQYQCDAAGTIMLSC